MTPVFLSTANHRYHPSDFMQVDPMLGGDAVCESWWTRAIAAHALVLAASSTTPDEDTGPSPPFWTPKNNPLTETGSTKVLPRCGVRRGAIQRQLRVLVGHRICPNSTSPTRACDSTCSTSSALDQRVRRGRVAIGLSHRNPPSSGGNSGTGAARVSRAVTIGELFGVCPESVGGGHFDSLMNYAFGTCAVGFVGGGVELRQDDAIGGDYQITPVAADGFRRAYGDVCAAYQSAHDESADGGLGGGSAHPSMLMNLFDSHDTARALWMLRGDDAALELLLLMQACAPGPPMIYQGTEVGQIGQLGLDGSGRDPHNRQAFPWHEPDAWDRNLLDHTRAIGRLRNENVALRRGGLRWRDALRAVSGETHSHVIAWDRYFDSDRDGETLLCVFHAGSERSGPMRVCTGFAPGTDLRVLHGEDDISMFAAGGATDGRGRLHRRRRAPAGGVRARRRPQTVTIDDENSLFFSCRGARVR